MKTAVIKGRVIYFICIAFVTMAMLMMGCGKKDSASKDTHNDYNEPSQTMEIVEDGRELPVNLKPANGVRSIRVRNLGSLRQVFNDSNYLQLEAAQRLGIEPLSDLSSYYFTRRPLVKVSPNEFYHIDSLRHSVPYLVPEAASLLEEIGKNFRDSLARRGGDSYKIKVTSLLRTPESVGRLRRVNINATDSSTHQYATTFDISYTNFYCLDDNRQINQGDLKNLLAEVLYDLRQQGKCLVKYEYKTGCFHVTVCE